LVLTGQGKAVLGDVGDRSALISAVLNGGHDSPQVLLTTFHPSLGYEDFVEGYKPAATGRGGLELIRRDGLFLTACELARKNPEAAHVLIIDEINRADLARVLGELVTLLELDKREVVTARLAVSGRPFAVPRNIRIIGTMNTADRSVAHLDAAVRRRFAFIEAVPDSAVLEAVVGPLNLASLLDELNERLCQHVGPDHQLGHAYLLENDLPVDSADAVAAAFYHDVVPQIEDYALGDSDVLARILGDQLVGPAGRVVTLEPEELLIALATEFSADAALDA
jgi:5-methylcytosine-specific restriction protein B